MPECMHRNNNVAVARFAVSMFMFSRAPSTSTTYPIRVLPSHVEKHRCFFFHFISPGLLGIQKPPKGLDGRDRCSAFRCSPCRAVPKKTERKAFNAVCPLYNRVDHPLALSKPFQNHTAYRFPSFRYPPRPLGVQIVTLVTI